MNVIPLLRGAVTVMTPLLFAAAGGLFPALAGTVNIALEGLLLIGAFSALAAYSFTGSIAAAAAAAVCASLALSALHAFTAFKLRANIFITGLAVNLFAGGLCTLLSDKLFNTRGVVTAEAVSRLPPWHFFSGLFLVLIAWLAIYKTPYGFRLRACENHSEALISLGVKPVFYQTSALLISGVCAGIGGSFLSLNLGAFVPGMSGGKGWIALVIIFLGGRKPQGILAAAFVFGLIESFSNHAQGLWNIPADFIFAFQYIIILLAVIVVSVVPRKI